MMIDWQTYALKAVLFHTLCYALYWAVLRESNYFSANRFYLLATLTLGFVVPILMLPISWTPLGQVITDVHVATRTFSEAESHVLINSSTQSPGEPVTVPDIIQMIYISGVLFLLLRSALGICMTMRIIARGEKNRDSSPEVITIKDGTSFSFFKTIVLLESAGHPVFLHEKCHVCDKHWLDLIYLEIVCIFSWTNPLVWFYKRSLTQQHEYLADDYVLRHSVSKVDYLECILNSLTFKGPLGPVHKFNSQSLKQRISMMTKDKFLPYPKLVYAAVIPLIALLFLSFSGSKNPEHSGVTSKIIVIDAAHGGSDAGAVSPSGLAEKEVALALARYVQDIGKSKGLNVVLTRSTDKTLSFKERLALATEARAEVFLSLHLGSDDKGVQNGVGIFLSEENIRYDDSKRLAAVLSQQLGDIKEFSTPQIGNFEAFVLKQNPAASAILEVGYLSDEEDVKFISEPRNQKKVAEKIVSALVMY